MAVGAQDRERLRARLARALAEAARDFDMIADGDRILCAVSGGKDSYTLHWLLTDLAARAPVRFEVVALNVDQGHPGYPGDRLARYMRERGHAFSMVHEDTYAIVKAKIPEGETMCALCSRLRRGILYSRARELGCNKIALGHHRDDVLATLLLNLMFAGQLKAMPPKLVSDEGDVVVVRPLAYCAEEDIAAFAAAMEFPILPCELCGSQPEQERRLASAWLAELDRRRPGVRASMLAALRNVRPSHLLDRDLWRALGLRVASEGAPGELVRLARSSHG
jgi:tRNA 2-thiocytidine biosynthesis protein TtcA